MIDGYQVGSVKVNPGLVLAPMSGVTTSSFRRLIKELNPGAVGLLVTEFVSVEGLTRQARRTVEMMRFVEGERPLAIQIFGYELGRMRDAARIVEDTGADIVDINCGCPAPKVVRKGGGCELMRQPDHLRQIFQQVRSAVSIPVTMKMRSGWDSTSHNCLEIAHMAQEEGLNAVAIHGRTRVQLYRGEADWSFAQEAVRRVSIPVVGSGDVVDRASAEQKLSTGVQGLMIGRGALSNPLIFSEIASGNAMPFRFNEKRCLEVLVRYSELLTEEFSSKASIGKLKQLASQMARGHAWRKELLMVDSFVAACRFLKTHLDRVSDSRAADGHTCSL